MSSAQCYLLDHHRQARCYNIITIECKEYSKSSSVLVYLRKSGLSWIIGVTTPLAVAIAWDGIATEQERKSKSVFNIVDLPSGVCVDPGVAWTNTASQGGHKFILFRILQSNQPSCASDRGTTVDGSYGSPIASTGIKATY